MKSKKKAAKAERLEEVPAGALGEWAPFALHPLRLETPRTWYPFVSTWAAGSSRVWWETLTATPMELSAAWHTGEKKTKPDKDAATLQKALVREVRAAEQQAKAKGALFQWQAEARPATEFLKSTRTGFVRRYTWDGRAGWLAILALSAGTRRALVSISVCPSAYAKNAEGEVRRLLNSIALAAPDEPARLCFAGLEAAFPPEFELTNVRGREGQCFAEARTKKKRAGLARLSFAEFYLAAAGPEKTWTNLARLLFDRGEVSDPLTTNVGGQIPFLKAHPELAEAEAGTPVMEIHGHKGSQVFERRRAHIKAGDWLMRRLGRPAAGGAAGLAWSCSESHAIWAVSARTGASDPRPTVRALADGVRCHETSTPDWSAYIEREVEAPKAAPEPKAAAANPKAPVRPDVQRRGQLTFKIQVNPEVRIEASKKDNTCRLVYPVPPPNGFIARALRGGSEAKTLWKPLDLDPLGRKAWELLSAEKSMRVADLVRGMSDAFAAHPVETFPKLLLFLRMLGERGLVQSAEPKK